MVALRFLANTEAWFYDGKFVDVTAFCG